MDRALDELLARAREAFPSAVAAPVEDRGETSVEVARDRLAEVADWLRAQGPFEMLADLSAVDFLSVEPPERRFLVALHLLSLATGARLRLRIFVPEGDERCPSVTGVWPVANWMEREAFDFFGIRFEGHPGLGRILMPDEWEGHPQRKDYPLGGVPVQYKGATVPPPDLRRDTDATTGYPGRTA